MLQNGTQFQHYVCGSLGETEGWRLQTHRTVKNMQLLFIIISLSLKSRVAVLRRFRCAVFMGFILENTLSTSALAAGRTTSLANRSDIRGNRTDIVSFLAGARTALDTA